MKPIEFQGPERTSSAFYYFAKNGIPKVSKKIRYIEDWEGDTNSKDVVNMPRAIVMVKNNKMPILWQALANKYRDRIAFFNHRDRRGKSSVQLGFEAGGDEAKVDNGAQTESAEALEEPSESKREAISITVEPRMIS